MSYLIRKITRSKWKDCDTNLETALSADAITNCLKTTGNTLSVWYAKDDDDIIKAKIALLASLEKVDTIHIVILNLDEVVKNELIIEETDGKTAAKLLVNLHRDISKLSIDELKKVASLVRKNIVDGKCERINERTFKQILNDAVSSNLIDKLDLPFGLAKYVEEINCPI